MRIAAYIAVWLSSTQISMGRMGFPYTKNSCDGAVASTLRFSADFEMADHVCCHNSHYAEPAGHLARTGFFNRLDDQGTTTFFDPVCGLPLFRAPVGRSFDEWRSESIKHGWPSFRNAETVWDNVVQKTGGEMISSCGTHLGHNLPDGQGDRFCINLVCIAGVPPTDTDAPGKDSL